MALNEGDKAPNFSLPASDGSTVSLKDLAGKKVVLYFYPKDNTSGCIKEACSFRDNDAALQQAGAVVLGVSKDSIKSHVGFAAKHNLPFKLLSDEDVQVATAYGAWGEKKLYGRAFMGMIRSTFLIDEQGNIAKAWPKVKAEGHGDAVLAAITGG
jgi:peroxiredoxin Q/BCP